MKLIKTSIILITIGMSLMSNQAYAETKDIPANAEMRNFSGDMTDFIKLWYPVFFMDNYVSNQKSILYSDSGATQPLRNFEGFDLCSIEVQPSAIVDPKTELVPKIEFSIISQMSRMVGGYAYNFGNESTVYTSPKMSITKINTFSTSLTHGWEVGFSLEWSGTLNAGVASSTKKIGMSGKYSGNSNVTRITTNSTMVDASPQPILLPPKSKRAVYQYIEIGEASGKFTTYNQIKPNSTIKVKVAGNGGCDGHQEVGYFRISDLINYVQSKEPAYVPSWIKHKDQSNIWYITSNGTFDISGGNEDAIVHTIFLEPEPLNSLELDANSSKGNVKSTQKITNPFQ